MSSLPIVHTSEESPRRLKNQEERWVPFQTLLTGRRVVAPLETEIQAIQLSPSRASLAASAMATAFSPVTAFLTCSCPLCLSTLGQCGDSRTFLRVLAHCMGDSHPRDAAHSIPNGLPRPFSLRKTGLYPCAMLLFQSRTGFPGHLAFSH